MLRRHRRTSGYRLSVSDDHLAPATLHRGSALFDEEPIDLSSTVVGAQHFTLSWRHVTAFAHQKTGKWWKSRKNKQETETEGVKVLDNVSGAISSGEMVAVIGIHKAGKSMILKILNGMKIPHITYGGQQLINGMEITPNVRKFFSYFPKVDSFFGQLTVEEHLSYQAVLSMDPTLSMQIRMAKIDIVIRELELLSCKKKNYWNSWLFEWNHS